MKDEGSYFSEHFTENIIRNIKIDKLYYEGKTKYQFARFFYNKTLGKVLFLDEKIQSAQVDEYIYHESLVHPVLITHPSPQRVLVIGGGEGATIREVLRYECVQKITMVDIDNELVELCQKYLPEWSEGAFSDPRVELIFEDADRFVGSTGEKFDVIISDLTEPVKEGPSVFLFTKEFFKKIFHALKADGLFVLQAGSTDSFYHQFFASCVKTLDEVFPLIRPYWTFMFSFGFPWGFVIASRKEDPLELDEERIKERMRERKIENLKYYHSGLHRGLFALPLYLIDGLEKGKILTDHDPYIWEL